MSTATPESTTDTLEGQGRFIRLLAGLERLGNKLPHPFWLFVGLGFVVLALSALLAAFDVRTVGPDGEEVVITNLLNAEGLTRILTEAVPNFTAFPPLGLIIIVMLGVAVAEHSGLISAAIRTVVSKVSARWLTFVLALTGVTGSVASDAIYVVLIPLGAMAFRAVGRSAVLGAVVAFGSASAGYNASLLVTGTDAILAGLSTSAAQLIDPEYVVSPIANYFFTIVSSLFLAGVVTLVTETILVRTVRTLGSDDEGARDDADPADPAPATTATGAADDAPTGTAASESDVAGGPEELRVSAQERSALLQSGLVALLALGVYLALLLIPASPLQGEEGVLDSPLLTDVVVPIALIFLICGTFYGIRTRSIRSSGDIPVMMGKGIVSLAPVIVLFFAAAQFVAYFGWSNIGPYIAITGSEILDRADLPLPVMFAGLLVLITFINFFITSGSAQYSLVAPVIVPLFMLLDVSPEVTQTIFRIGDSPTNIVTPMSPYFALALGFIQRYNRRAGIGTLLSMTVPLAFIMLIAWFAFFLLWYALGIPLGPGVPVR